MAVKWKINEHEIERNPISFFPRPAKKVSYQRAVTGNQIREVPQAPELAITWELEASWHHVSEDFKNFLYDLYVLDRKVYLETHVQDPRDKWMTRIDEFEATCLSASGGKYFDVDVVFRVQNGILDPIITKSFSLNPYPFVVDNTTNRNVTDATIFIRPINKPLVNPKIVQTYKNLLTNPGFEQITRMDLINNWSGSTWESDIIYFLEGRRCLKTFRNNQTLVQRVACPDGESMSLVWSCLGDIDGIGLRASVVFYNPTGAQVGMVQREVMVSREWDEHELRFDVPAGASQAEVRFVKTSGEQNRNSCVYLDAVALTLDDYYSSTAHSPLQFLGEVGVGDVLKIDLRTSSVYLNNEDASHLVEGSYFYLPPGKSILLISDESTQERQLEVTVRYNEEFI